jgi:hypothetical protein
VIFIFLSLLLAATSHDAGGDTFLIHTISLPTVSNINSYVFLRLCITIASGIIRCCWKGYFFEGREGVGDGIAGFLVRRVGGKRIVGGD